MRRIPVLSPRRYDVVVGAGALAELATVPGRVAVVVDETVAALHGETIRRVLGSREVAWLPVASGEAQKSLDRLGALWSEFAEFRLERGETVVAIGGGVVGDLAGFAAATWRRGVSFVQVPTSLLAQVDASVGGKVAIDHAGLKNPVGAFHHPSLVLADTTFLATLPGRECWSGLSEVVKVALLAGGEVFGRVEASLESLAAGEGPVEEIVSACVSYKAGVVQRDPEERGERAVLNLGHTIGHALESAAGGRLLHGEAVAWGLRAMVALAGPVAPEVVRLIERLPAPSLSGLDPSIVLAHLAGDKKTSGGRARFVFCRAPGRVEHGVEVESARVREVVEALVSRGS